MRGQVAHLLVRRVFMDLKDRNADRGKGCDGKTRVAR